jgi:Skp family chaperone for outer membrane proteins
MLRRLALIALIALSAPAAGAQDQGTVLSPILTIDQDRLFAETRPGLRSMQAIEAEADALVEENRRIEMELRAEEIALTEERGTLDPDAFAELADAFDAKVQRIRAAQDAKARDLALKQEEARQSFFLEIGGVLSEIVRERGAVMILDRRDVFLSADGVDITDDAIARINAAAEQDAPAEADGAVGDPSEDPSGATSDTAPDAAPDDQ